MKVLVTGAAGFIGSAVVARLAEKDDMIVGLDNINDYYEQSLKLHRLTDCGIVAATEAKDFPWYKFVESAKWPEQYRFIRMNLEDTQAMRMLFANGSFDAVINLGAQAGVRYSITNPHAYIESNVDGFINVLEGCRDNNVKHLVYASSSSVYGLNGQVPFSEHHGIAHPVSLYAATKKSNELMAHAYSKLYNLPTTGLRFFTVYGPWGRPDMSPFLFMDAILHDRPIKVFNNGDMLRDFTYIDDIVEGIVRIVDVIPEGNKDWDETNPDPATSPAPYRIYNIGNSHPTKLMDYIQCIEKAIGRKAKKEFLPMQQGDVYQTYADSSALAEATGFKPNTPLQLGIDRTVEWFKNYYNLK
ncbi:MAG: NAD-dependent epimerase [Muribaculaceae bacterium]|nr:NAD-dependent epimerase [Muribaculaceae bacterium]